MTIIGIDIGITNNAPCALAVYDPHADRVFDTFVIKPLSSDDVDMRIIEIGLQINERIKQNDSILAIAYELPHYSENHQTTIKLARMCGAIVMLAGLRFLPVYGVQPTAAKVALTGWAQADKAEMIKMAAYQYGQIATSHEADAIGVALAGWAQYKAAHLVEVA